MKRYFVLFAALGAMTASMAIAQTGTAAQTAPPAGIRARVQRKMMQALNLTAAQKQQAKTIRQNTHAQVQPLAQQIQQDRESLTAAIEAGDSAKIQQLSTAMGSLRGQQLALRSTGEAQFYALLTPDQKAKMADFQQKAKQLLGKGE